MWHVIARNLENCDARYRISVGACFRMEFCFFRTMHDHTPGFFFLKNGHVATMPLVNYRTVNSEWHTTFCLPEVFEEIKKNNQRHRILLHHDNAKSVQEVFQDAYFEDNLIGIEKIQRKLIQTYAKVYRSPRRIFLKKNKNIFNGKYLFLFNNPDT